MTAPTREHASGAAVDATGAAGSAVSTLAGLALRFPGYHELARREAEHWGNVAYGPHNPQIWEDAVLQELFFGAEERRFFARAVASGRRVLELGCGHGELATELARLGLRVTAIDLSADRIEWARANATAYGPDFLVGNLDTMALPDGPFDCVVAHDALHHIVDIERLLDGVQRVLRPGGTLLVFDFRGMSRPARLLSAALYAILPTYKSYAAKWVLRRRLTAFLATEGDKRAALARGDGAALHADTPFEGISQESITRGIAERFEIREHRTFLPFWWYLAPKLRLGRLRHPVARAFRAWDAALERMGAGGAYFVLEARRRPDAAQAPEPSGR